jgi:hypothetical protein
MRTVVGTVGFGDITPASTSERLYILLLMLVSTCIFSRLMGDMHDVLQLSTREEETLNDRMAGVVRFLHLNRVPIALQQRIRAWAGFKFVRDRADEQVKEVMAMLPEGLRLGVAQNVTKTLFSRVLLLRKVHDPLDRASLAAALLPRLRLTCYAKDEVVASHREPADRLMLVLDGRVLMTRPRSRLELDQGQPRDRLLVLRRGDSIGETAVRTLISSISGYLECVDDG